MPGGKQDLNFTNVWIDEYGFKKKLGSGGSASVWLADECANREVIQTVAIKVFVDDFNNRDSFNETFANFQLDLKFLAELAPNARRQNGLCVLPPGRRGMAENCPHA